MSRAIPPFPQFVSMTWYSVKHRGKFTFLPKRDDLSGEHKLLNHYGVNGKVRVGKFCLINFLFRMS